MNNRLPKYQHLQTPTIFAHRGASVYAPENTLSSFLLAISQNADAIELDAKLCASGEVVVIHDPSVDRTTNGLGKVLELPLKALREFDAGSWFGTDFQGEGIPTLDEVFEVVGRKIFINVEITNYASPCDDLPNSVVELVRRHGLQESVLFSSFNPLALRKANKLLPEVPIGLLALPGIQGAWARSWPGRFVPHQALHPEMQDTTLNLINKQHRLGRRVHVWTVNSADNMRTLFNWKIDGIFTDDPLLAQQILTQATS
ncbi:MAG: glycerophosphodiester phosphodiesterase [Anaerolineales bacterium]|jgi:glycerophosphoryl diester phosphodiesterase